MTLTWLVHRMFGMKVDPSRERVFKVLPTSPPRRRDYVYIDGVRFRVVSSRVKWREPGVWTAHSLRVKLDA